MMYIRY